MKISDDEIQAMQDKVDEIKALKEAGESVFTALSYFKSFIHNIMFRDFFKE